VSIPKNIKTGDKLIVRVVQDTGLFFGKLVGQTEYTVQ
jgi:hypothetical protein